MTDPNEADQVFVGLSVNSEEYSDGLISQYLHHDINHCKEDMKRRKQGAKARIP